MSRCTATMHCPTRSANDDPARSMAALRRPAPGENLKQPSSSGLYLRRLRAKRELRFFRVPWVMKLRGLVQLLRLLRAPPEPHRQHNEPQCATDRHDPRRKDQHGKKYASNQRQRERQPGVLAKLVTML